MCQGQDGPQLGWWSDKNKTEVQNRNGRGNRRRHFSELGLTVIDDKENDASESSGPTRQLWDSPGKGMPVNEQ